MSGSESGSESEFVLVMDDPIMPMIRMGEKGDIIVYPTLRHLLPSDSSESEDEPIIQFDIEPNEPIIPETFLSFSRKTSILSCLLLLSVIWAITTALYPEVKTIKVQRRHPTSSISSHPQCPAVYFIDIKIQSFECAVTPHHLHHTDHNVVVTDQEHNTMEQPVLRLVTVIKGVQEYCDRWLPSTDVQSDLFRTLRELYEKTRRALNDLALRMVLGFEVLSEKLDRRLSLGRQWLSGFNRKLHQV